MEKNCFVVTCRGWSASLWLANAYHMHNQVMCSHSVSLITDYILSDFKEREAPIHVIDNLMLNLSDLTKDKRNFHLNISSLLSNYFRNNASVLSFFEQLQRLGEADCYGCVHTYRQTDLSTLEKLDDSNVDFRLANLIRHPVDTVISASAELIQSSDKLTGIKNYSESEIQTKINQIVEVFEDYHPYINPDMENLKDLGFLMACVALNGIAQDLNQIPLEGNILMEKVTQERDYFEAILMLLTNNSVSISDKYLNDVFQTQGLNAHDQQKKKQTSEQIYAQFSTWQKKTFDFFIQQDNLADKFQTLGYNLEFIS